MTNLHSTLEDLLTLDGAIAAGLVDSDSGMLLEEVGSGFNMEVAAAGNTDVVRAKLNTVRMLNLNDSIVDILITLNRQYHILRPLPSRPTTFLYLALQRARANLAMARIRCEAVANAINIG